MSKKDYIFTLIIANLIILLSAEIGISKSGSNIFDLNSWLVRLFFISILFLYDLYQYKNIKKYGKTIYLGDKILKIRGE